MTVSGRISSLRMVLYGEAPIEFDKLARQNNGTTNTH